jgi:hypothetical protein
MAASLKVKLAEGWCEMAIVESMIAGKLAKPYAEKAAEKVRGKIDEAKEKVKSKYEDVKDVVGKTMQDTGSKLRKDPSSKVQSGGMRPLPLDEAQEERRRESRTATAPRPKEKPKRTLPQWKKGGMVSSVSKRADGIAKRGRTHCKIC